MVWPCDRAYEPQEGTFTERGWTTDNQYGNWWFGHVSDTGPSGAQTANYELRFESAVIDTFSFEKESAFINWQFLEDTILTDRLFLIVRIVREETTGDENSLEVFHLGLDGTYDWQTDYWAETVYDWTDGFHLEVAPDNSAVFSYVGTQAAGSSPATDSHSIRRLADGKWLCSTDFIQVNADREARVSDEGFQIRAGDLVFPDSNDTSCRLPRGRLALASEAECSDTVVGDISTTEVSVFNAGDDCLRVLSIDDDDPFTVTAVAVNGVPANLPFDLSPEDGATITVQFAPTTPGENVQGTLPITLAPDALDSDPDSISELSVTCTALPRIPDLRFNALTHSFGEVEVGPNTTETWTLTARNDGSADVQIDAVNASAPGFTITGVPTLPSTLEPGEDTDLVTVTFDPSEAGDYHGTIEVESDDTEANASDPNDTATPHEIALVGTGCIAGPELSIPGPGTVDFGPVERGFRTVRPVTVRNEGRGELVFNARIQAVDDAGDQEALLFGIQTETTDSVTDVQPQSSPISIRPEDPCGSQPAGSGEHTFGVVFFADPEHESEDDSVEVEAELVIEKVTDQAWPADLPDELQLSLSAELLPPTPIDVGLVLDRSGSMAGPSGEMETKTQAEIQAADLFVQLLREGLGQPNGRDRATGVKFNETPEVFQPIVEIDAETKSAFAEAIDGSQLEPEGATSISGGVMAALDELETPRDPVPPDVGRGLVVLSDGMENRAYRDPDEDVWYSIMGGWMPDPDDPSSQVTTLQIPVPSDVRIYAVAMGTDENVDLGRLDQLAGGSGGVYDVVGALEGQSYFDLAKRFVQAFMEIAGHQAVLDPIYTLVAGEEQRTEFDVTREDASALVVVYDKDGKRLPFHLVTPTGERIAPGLVPSGFQLRAGASDIGRFVEVRMPRDEPSRYAGRWHVLVRHPGEICYGTPDGVPNVVGRTHPDRLTWKKGFVPLKCEQSTDAASYSVTIGVKSDVRIQAHVTPGIVGVGEPILLTAVVSEAGLPGTGWTVRVAVVSPGGEETTLVLNDDGTHRDGEEDDGEYAREFTRTHQAGSYQFTFRASGRTRDGERVTREATRAKYVEGRTPVSPERGPSVRVPTNLFETYLTRLERLIRERRDPKRSGYRKD